MGKKKHKKREKNTQHILTEMNRSSQTPGSVTIEFTYFDKRYRGTAFEVTNEPSS